MNLTPFSQDKSKDKKEVQTIFLEVFNLEGYMVKKCRIGIEDPLPDNLNLAEGYYHFRLRQCVETLK